MREVLRKGFHLLILVPLGAFASAPISAQEPSAEAAGAFVVIRTHCLACHDSRLRSGRLLMETAADLIRGGAHGAAVVPGKSGESRMIRMILGEITPRMPLEGALRPEEIDLLRNWIDAGSPAWAPADPEPLKVPDIRPAAPVPPPVNSLAFSPDGAMLAAAGYREVRLLHAESLRPKITLRGAADMVRAVAFSPDGKLLAAAGGEPSRYGEVVFWSLGSGQMLRKIRGHQDFIYGIAFSPDGRLLASSSYDRLIKLWDVESGRELKTLKEHTDAVFPVAFSPDGKRLASASADRSVKIWEVASGKRLYTMGDAADVLFTLAFHPGGERITASGADKYIRTWSAGNEGAVLLQSIIAHEAEVTKLVYFPDGRRLASASADRTLKLWNMENGEIAKVLEPQPDWVLSMTPTPDGRFLAVGRYDGSIAYYDAETGERRGESLQARIPDRATNDGARNNQTIRISAGAKP